MTTAKIKLLLSLSDAVRILGFGNTDESTAKFWADKLGLPIIHQFGPHEPRVEPAALEEWLNDRLNRTPVHNDSATEAPPG